MKYIKSFICFILSLFFCFSLIACNNDIDTIDLFAFNSAVHIEVYNRKIQKTTKTEIQNILSALDNELSISKPNSTINAFNKDNVYSDISFDAYNIIKSAKQVYEFSEKKFNPAIYPLSYIWHFSPDNLIDESLFSPPTDAQISNILNGDKLDFSAVSSIEENGKFLLIKDKDIKIDLGGIVKGYATSKIANLLKNDGITKGYINLGASSLYLFSVDSLGIRHPENDGVLLNIDATDYKNVNISTSGDYEKYYNFENKRYCHIIDPLTGKSYNTNIRSATVIGFDGAFTDGITTALLLSDYDKQNPQDCPLYKLMNKLIEKENNCLIFAVYDDGITKAVITNANKSLITLSDENYEIVNI